MHRRGFTTIELLTVISIIALATTISFPSIQSMRKNVVVNGAGQEVVDALRLAQNRAIASQDGTSQGVFFEQTQYTVYSGDCTSRNNPEVHQLGNGMQIQGSAVSRDILFSRLSGAATAYDCSSASIVAMPSIIVGSPGGSIKTITVNTAGAVGVQ